MICRWLIPLSTGNEISPSRLWIVRLQGGTQNAPGVVSMYVESPFADECTKRQDNNMKRKTNNPILKQSFARDNPQP
ncbi:hypothetical protein VTN49DRAFT_4826 [Thermomyces lanuginosus]|uniref:uncharacterized protein n=1 Tax=Thermomyces lanuginosus TaxID=5541 RepID=UPI00374468C8